VGFATRDPLRRNNVNPGTCRSTSSTLDAALVAMVSRDKTMTDAGVSVTRVSVRVAVTVIDEDD
jgi:hypothetical protein